MLTGMLLKGIEWGCSKADVRNLFSGYTELPPHPSQNAIGFLSDDYGTDAGVVCYFKRHFFKSQLARVVMTFFEARPPDTEVLALYDRVEAELIGEYGPPADVRDAGELATEDVPVEFRQSRMLSWFLDGSTLTLSMSLLRDGVSPASTPLGVGFGSTKADPISAMQAKSHSSRAAG